MSAGLNDNKMPSSIWAKWSERNNSALIVNSSYLVYCSYGN